MWFNFLYQNWLSTNINVLQFWLNLYLNYNFFSHSLGLIFVSSPTITFFIAAWIGSRRSIFTNSLKLHSRATKRRCFNGRCSSSFRNLWLGIASWRRFVYVRLVRIFFLVLTFHVRLSIFWRGCIDFRHRRTIFFRVHLTRRWTFPVTITKSAF